MTFNHRQKIHTFLTCMLVFIIWLFCFFFHLGQSFDNALFDLREKSEIDKRIPPTELIVVTIDDKSLDAMKRFAGRWPWPRSVHAELIEGLNTYSPQAIAFDVLFNEPDVYRPDDDLYFAQVVEDADNIYLALLGLEYHNQSVKNHYPLALFPFLKQLNSQQMGSVNVLRQDDAVVRQYYSKVWINDQAFLSLGAKISDFAMSDDTPIKLQWQNTSAFEIYSYVDIFNAVATEDAQFLTRFRDKRILIGATAAGLFDEVSTPISNSAPGVFVIANAAANYLNGTFYISVSDWLIISTAFLLIMCVSSIYFYNTSLVIQFSVSCVVLVLALVLVWYIYLLLAPYSLDLPVATLSLSAVLALLLQFLMQSYVQYREKQFANKLFGRFLDPNVVKNLLDHQNLAQFGSSEIVEVTVLFSDIRNFTSLSEKHDVSEVVALLNDYLSMQVATIFKHNGTLDKFIGDAVMAFWGAPLQTNNHAEQAVLAALEMEQNLIHFRATLPNKYQSLDIGIGIHSGKVLCGFIGTEQRLDYTVLGDTVNLASRVEGLTKTHNRILVTQQTAQRTKLNYQFVDKVLVKGREQPVELLTPER
ncbi:CHASE2 domain-containing protein [Pseudoalteromonas piratica]|nr:adenylate/guanylate cyclase domain-containing protein [Pseudoalteromonas piratica]